MTKEDRELKEKISNAKSKILDKKDKEVFSDIISFITTRVNVMPSKAVNILKNNIDVNTEIKEFKMQIKEASVLDEIRKLKSNIQNKWKNIVEKELEKQ